jgi:hypothetical protein
MQPKAAASSFDNISSPDLTDDQLAGLTMIANTLKATNP